MDFGKRSSSRSRKKIKPLSNGRDASKYQHVLQMYRQPPIENISLQEFQDFAIDRLKVLQAVENVGIKYVRGSEDYATGIAQALKKAEGLKAAIRKQNVETDLKEDDYDERRKDHISHFILRLAYCRTEELRRWFLQQELDLFRYRFCQENETSIKEFMDLNKLEYSPIPEEERNEIAEKLANAQYGLSTTKVRGIAFYKVPFLEALELVRARKCYLSKGYAYVPYNDLIVIVLSVFRSHLSRALAVTMRSVPHLEEDGRLMPLLSNISKRYLGQDYNCKNNNSGQITADMIDPLSKKSFPPCMQNLHQSLRQTHHMKHWGRQQYGLFLKGIGVSMEEALRFWRSEFTKNMDPDKFDKSYSYNIRHNYGKEGKRADYTPYSCIKIIMSNTPGPGDAHGCPFRHTDIDLLKQRLDNMKISKEAASEIVDKVKQSHYQTACGLYFGATQKVIAGEDFVPNHPNQYFEESQKLEKGEKSIEGTPKGTPRTVRIVKVHPKKDEFDDVPLSMEEIEKLSQNVQEET